MKKMNRFIFLVFCVFIALLCLLNGLFFRKAASNKDREYRVSINRIEWAIHEYEEENRQPPASLSALQQFAGEEQYTGISGLYYIDVNAPKEELVQFLQDEPADYVILATAKYYYRITYDSEDGVNKSLIFTVNAILILIMVVMLLFLFYIRQTLLLPFFQFSDIPYELSKGNLTIPLKENKNRFFGKYIWGMNLLRENLEESKVRELQLQKEKKLLLLSLSHDIKTPLSAIKLYAKALSKGLYKEAERKQEITEKISEKADEIETYISEIVRASNEDFLRFDVENKEFYSREVLECIREYYEEKMALNQIHFEIGAYDNCLLLGDPDRLVEVLQNIIENGIKYGDGKRIWLTVRKEEEEYRITVRSTGCKLPRKELPHLFDSFFRGSNVGKKPGSGLGLYICRQLMHLMEGEVTAAMAEQEDGDRVMAVNVVVRLA